MAIDPAILLAAEIDTNAPTIDLHNAHNVQDALDLLERELFLSVQRGVQYCVVVHGIGEGKLMAAVHGALSKNPMVHEFQKMNHGGSTIVVF